jgi:hypothetical protein
VLIASQGGPIFIEGTLLSMKIYCACNASAIKHRKSDKSEILGNDVIIDVIKEATRLRREPVLFPRFTVHLVKSVYSLP